MSKKFIDVFPVNPNHSFMTCGGPKAFTSTTIVKKCGGETSSGGQ